MVSFNLVRWFKSLFRSPVRTLVRKPRFHLHLEVLETRLAPALYTWTGAHEATAPIGVNNLWSDPLNWKNNIAPPVSAITPVELQFDSTGYSAKPNVDNLPGLLVDQLTIASGSYTINSNGTSLNLQSPSAGQATITVNGGIGTQIINAPITFGSATASTEFLQVQSASTLTLNGTLTANSATLVTQEGPGTVTVTANNGASFVGPFTISDTLGNGTTVITNANSLGNGTSAANIVTVNANTELQLNLLTSPSTIQEPFVISGSGTNGIDGAIVMRPTVGGAKTILKGAITMDANSTIGVSALVLTGTTAFGSTTITGLASTANIPVGTAIQGPGIPANATVASIVSGTSITISGAATATGAAVSLSFLDALDTLEIDGVISDANSSGSGYSLSKEGPGTLFLNPNNPLAASNSFDGGNMYHGNTYVNGGELQIGQPYALGVGGATTVVNSNNVESGTLSLNYTGNLQMPAADLVYAQVQTFTFTGSSQFTLSYNGVSTLPITYGGNIANTVQSDLNALATINGIGATVTVSQTGNVLYITFGGSLGGFEIPTISATVTSGAGTATVATTTGNLVTPAQAAIGFIVPDESLTLNGAGLEGLHDNLGFGITSASRTTPTAAAINTFTGALSNSAGDNSWEGQVNFWSTTASVAQNQELGYYEPAVAIGAALGTNLTIDGQITDNGIGAAGNAYSFSKVGFGRVILTADNTYTSDIDILNGILNIRDSHALGNVTNIGQEVYWGATLELQADGIPDSQTASYNLLIPSTDDLQLNGTGFIYPGASNGEGALDNLSGVNIIDGNIQLNSSVPTTTIGVAPDPDPSNIQGATWNDLSQLTINGVITDPFNVTTLTKTGYGELVLTNDNSYVYDSGVTGQDTFETFIEQGWITAENDFALGGTIANRNAVDEPGVQVLPGAALVLKQDPAGNSLTLNYNLSLSGSGMALPQPLATLEPWLTGPNAEGDGALESLDGANTETGNIYLDGIPIQFEGTLGLSAQNLIVATSALTGPGAYVGTDIQTLGTSTNNEVQVLDFAGDVTGGNFTLSFTNSAGVTDTATIAWSNNNTTLVKSIQSALQGFANIGGAANVTVGGTNAVAFGVETDGANDPTPFPSQLTLTGSILDPANNPITTNVGTTPAPTIPAPPLSGELVKLGSQRLILQGAGVYSGGVDVQVGVLRIENDDALGTPSVLTGNYTTTVENGAALEMAPENPLLTGGNEQGLQIWYDNLVLNGSGDATFGDAALTVLSNDNLWRGPITLNSDINVTFDVPNSAFFQDATITMTADSTNLSGGTVTVADSNPGGSGLNAVQTLNFSPGVTGGTFTLTVSDSEQQNLAVAGSGTFALSFIGYSTLSTATLSTTGLTASAVASALNTLLQTPGAPGYLSATSYGTATVTGPVGGPFVVTLGGNLAGTIAPLLLAQDETGTAAITPSFVTATTGAITWSASPSMLVNNIQTALNLLTSAFTDSGTFPAASIVNVNLSTPVIDVFPNSRLTVTGAIGDQANAASTPADLTVTGTGELALAGANTYRGTTYVNEGILTISNPQALGTGDSAAVQLLDLSSLTVGSTFSLKFPDGNTGTYYTTAPITYTGVGATDAADIAAALNLLPSISVAQAAGSAIQPIAVTAVSNTQFDIQFNGNFIGFNQPNLIPSPASISVVTQTTGAGGTVVAAGAQLQLQGGIDVNGEPIMIQGQGVSQESELQLISAGGAPASSVGIASTFTLGFTNPTTQLLSTTTINVGASAAQVQFALNSLLSIQQGATGLGTAANPLGSVSVTETGVDTYEVLFGGSFTGAQQSIIVPAQILAVSGTSGTFTLTFGSSTTAALAYNVPATGGAGPTGSIQNALNAILAASGSPGYVSPSVHGDVASITVNADGSFTIFFGGTLSEVNVPVMIPGSFTGSTVATVNATGVTVFTTELIQGGTANATPTQFFSSGPTPVSSADINVSTNTTANLGGPITSIAPDPFDGNIIYITTAGGGAWKTTNDGQTWTPLFDGVSTVQTLTITGSSPTADTFSLTYTSPTTGATSTTVTLPYNATADQIEAAVNAVVGTGNSVSVTQDINTNGNNEVQEIVLNTSSSTWLSESADPIHYARYYLTFEGKTTAAIPFMGNAAQDQSQIQTALDALATIGGLAPTPGSVSVQIDPAPPAAFGTPADEGFTITFQGGLADAPEPLITFAIGASVAGGHGHGGGQADFWSINPGGTPNYPNPNFPTINDVPATYIGPLPTQNNNSDAGALAQITLGKGPTITDTITFSGGGLANVNVPILAATVNQTALNPSTVIPAIEQAGVGAQAAMFSSSIVVGGNGIPPGPVGPLDDNVLFLGTGVDNDAEDPYYGTGVYESTDDGQTWTLLQDLTLAAPNPLYGMSVNKIVLDPANDDIYVATSDVGTSTVNGFNSFDTPTITHPGVWRYNLATGNWLDLTDITSVNRATVVSGQGFQTQANPPDNPGPDDNYLLTFPQRNASWSDLAISDNPNDGGVTLYAALGTTGNSPANGVYTLVDPAAVSVAAPPAWWLGDQAAGVDARTNVEFPTAAQAPDNLIDPPGGPGDIGSIKIALVTGANGTSFAGGNGTPTNNANFPLANDEVVAAVTYSSDANNPSPNNFYFLEEALDSGQDWNGIAGPPVNYMAGNGNHSSAILVTATDMYVGGTDPGGDDYVWDFNGGAWNNISTDAAGNGPHQNINTFAFLGTTLYVGTSGGIWTYNTTTDVWTDISGNLANTAVVGAASDPTNPDIVFGVGRGVGVVEYNGNQNWTQVEGNTNQTGNLGTLSSTSVAVDPNNSKNVYAIMGQGQLTVSTTGGGAGSWSTVYTDPLVNGPAMVVDSFSRVFVGGSALVVSSNQGSTFTNLAAPAGTVTSIAVADLQGGFQADPGFPTVTDLGAQNPDAKTIAIVDSGTVYVSKDLGVTWQPRSVGLPNTPVTDIAISPVDRDDIVVTLGGQAGAASTGQVWESTNAGQTWTNISSGLPAGVPARSVVIDPRFTGTPGTIYVGTDLGVYVDVPALVRSFVPFGLGSIPMVSVQSLDLNQTTNILTVGTAGRGVFQFYLDSPSANAGAIVATGGSDVWNGPVILAGPTTISSTGNRDLENAVTATELLLLGQVSDSTYAASISGANTLTMNGTGDVLLAAANTYSGVTLINQGDVVVANPSALGGGAVASSQELFLSGAVAGSTQFTVSFNGAGPPAPITYTGTSADAAAIQTALNNLSSIGGVGGSASVTQITAGDYLIVFGGSLLGNTTLITSNVTAGLGSSFSAADGTTVVTNGSGLLLNTSLGTLQTLAGALTTGQKTVTGLASTVGLSIGEPVTGAGIQAGTTVTAIGPGNQVTISKNAISGGTVTLVFGTTEPLYLFGNGAENQSGHYAGALENASGPNTYTGTITLENTSTIGVDGTSSLTIGSPAVGTPAITDLGAGFGVQKEGSGTLTLVSGNNYTGGTTVNEGILNVQNNNALGLAGTTTTVLDGAQLQLKSLTLTGLLATGTNTITGLTTIVGLSVGQTVSGPGIPAGTTVTLVGPGNQVTLSQNATATGAASVLFGSVAVTTQNLSLSGTGILNSGALENVGGSNTWGSASTTITLSAVPGFSPESSPGNVTIGVSNAGETLTLGSVITQPASTVTSSPGLSLVSGLTKVGLGKLTLTQSDTYSGTNYINNGILDIQNSGALGTANGNEIQRITTRDPGAADSFTLTFGGSTTASIPFGASAATVAADLNGLGTIGTGGVTVAENDVNSGISQVLTETLTNITVGNTIRWTFGAATTAPITYTGNGATDAAAIQTALNGLTTIANAVPSFVGSVIVTANSTDTVFTITFAGSLADSKQAFITVATANIAAGTSSLQTGAAVVTHDANTGVGFPTLVYTVTFSGSAFAGNPQALLLAAPSVPGMTAVVSEVALGNAGTNVANNATLELDGDPTHSGAPGGIAPSQILDLYGYGQTALTTTGTIAAGSTFKLSVGTQTTGPINAALVGSNLATAIQTALSALSNVGLTQTGALTAGSSTITALASTASLSVGQAVSGVGIPAGATISTIVSATSVTISAPATATGVTSLTFSANVTVLASPTNNTYTIVFASTVATPVVYLASSSVTGGTVAVSTPGALENASGNNTWAGRIVLPTSLAVTADAIGVDPTSTLNVTGSIQDPNTAPLPPNSVVPATLVKLGAGTLNLPNANTYAGSNYIDAGDVDIGNTGSLGINNSAEQEITVSGTSGTFTLGFVGYPITVTTTALTVNPVFSAATLQTALNAMLSNVNAPGGGAGTVSLPQVIGGNSFVVTFGGSLTGVTVPLLKKLSSTGGNANAVAITLLPGASSATIVDSTALGGSAQGASLQLPISIPASAITFKPLTLNGAGYNNAGALENISGVNTLAVAITLGSNASIGADTGSQLNITSPIGDGGLGFGVNIVSKPTLAGTPGTGIVDYAAALPNTYTGPTTVLDGTLQLDDGTSGGAVQGALNVGGSTAAATAVDQVQQFSLAGFATGTDQFKLTYNAFTTMAITYYSNSAYEAAQIQAALNAVLAPISVTVVATATPNQFNVTFAGSVAGTDPAALISGSAVAPATGTVSTGTILTHGALAVANAAEAQLLASNQINTTSPVTVNADGLFDLNDFIQSIAALTINSDAVAAGTASTGVSGAGGGHLTVAGPVQITGGNLNTPGLGDSVTVNGATGSLTMNGGTMTEAGQNSSVNVTGPVTMTGGAIDATGLNSQFIDNGVMTMIGGAVNLSNTGSQLNVTGSMVMTGGAAVNLNGPSDAATITGPLSVTDSSITAAGAGSTETVTGLFTLIGSTVNLSGSGSQLILDGNLTANSDAVGGSADIFGQGAVTLNDTVATPTFTVNHSGTQASDLIISAAINDSAAVVTQGTTTGVTKAGAGQLELDGVDNYGTTTINAGNVQVDQLGIQTVTLLGFNPGDTFNLTYTNGALHSQTLTPVTYVGDASGAMTAANILSALQGVMTFLGLPMTDVAVSAVTMNVFTVTFKLAAATNLIPMTGAHATGTGVVLVANVNNTGTVVLAGGNIDGTGTVGTITGAASPAPTQPPTGNLIDPGANGSAANTGILQVNGNLNLAAGTTLFVDLNNLSNTHPSPIAGSDYDQINVNGNVNLNGALLSGSITANVLDGDTFTILTANSISGTLSGIFNGVQTTIPTTNGFVFFGSPQEKFAVTYNSTSIVLTRVLKNVSISIATVPAGLNPSVYGQDVPYVATITTEPGAGNFPSGTTVTFTFDNPALGETVTYAIPAGVSTYTTPQFDPQLLYGYYTPGSSNFINVTFKDNGSPATFNPDSLSPTYTQTVNQNATNIALTSSPANPVYGDNVTVTATITPSTPLTLPNAFTPTGMATFTVDGTTYPAVNIVNLGNESATPTATFVVPASLLSAGTTHIVKVSYNGDAYYQSTAAAGSSPVSLSLSIQKNSTTVSVSASPAAGSTFGQAATFTATVLPNAPGVNGALPTSTVSFYDGTAVPSNLIGTSTLNASGQATVTTSSLTVFTHSINVVYNGDSNYLGTNNFATPLSYIVNPAPTATTFVSENPDPSNYGLAVVLTANVVANPSINPGLGLPTPTGLVNFWLGAASAAAGGTLLGSGTVNAAGNASATTAATALMQGTVTLFAVYAGDPNYVGSTGVSPGFVVNPGITTTTLTASPVAGAGSTYGQAITLTAAVTFVAGVPTTGSVSFVATNTITSTVTPLGTANVNAQGKAIFTPAIVLPAASYSISASYTDTLPDTNFGPSVGNIASYTIAKSSTATVVTATPASTDVSGESVTFTATISAVAPGAGTPADGTLVTFKDGSIILGTGATISGKATFTTAGLTVGFHNISATFPGDANFINSIGTLSSFAVGKSNSSTVLTASPASGDVFGQSVTFTATVTAVAPGVGIPTDGDLVTFKDGLNVIGTGTTAGGVATLTLSTLSVGNHPTISAIFPGDTNFGTSTGTISNFAVGKASTATTVAANPASGDVFGESVSITATVASVAPGSGTPANGDTVTFKDGATTLGSMTLTNGSAVFSTSSLSVGAHSISATFSGDSNYLTSTGNLNNLPANNYSVATAPTSTTLSVSPVSGDIYSQSVTFTAHVTVLSPGAGAFTGTDTVSFKDNGVTIGAPAAVSASGVATLTISTLSAGLHSITATYSGNTNLASSTGLLNGSPSNNYTVGQASTTTGLSASPSSNDTYGQSVTLTASVSVVSPGVGSPATGDVITFMDGVAILGTGTLNSSGLAFLTTSSLIAGTHTLTATFGGDTNFAASSGALNGVTANNFTVNQASTLTTLTATPISGDVSGEAVTFTAAVSAIAPGAGVPANGDIVTFKDGSVTLGNGTIAGGVATFTTSTLAVGTHSITATFVGDGNFATSAAGLNGNPFNNYTVGQAATTTTVTATPSSGDVYGQSVTITAAVAALAPGAGTAANGDTITFTDGGTTIGTGVVSGGVATFTTSSLVVGNHTLAASFSGDTNFTGSSGSLNNVSFNNFLVSVAGTSTSVTASPANGDVFGQAVTFTAAVSAVAPGAGVPANGDVVTFKDGGATLGTGTISGGVATFHTTSLAVGAHTITATFAGDPNLGVSTGNLFNIPLNNYTVNKANTTTTVTAVPATTIFGQAVTFTAAISANIPGSGLPANGDVVTFFDGSNQIGIGHLVSGVATFATSSLMVGIHSITATFAGDSNFVTSTGGLNNVSVNNFTVTQPLTTTTVSASPNSTVFGQAVIFTANVAVVSPGIGQPANGDTVNFFDAGNPIGSGTLSGGVASLTTTNLAAGLHTITATFTGDANFAPSSGNLNNLASNNFTVTPDAVSTSVTATPSIGDVFGESVTLSATLTAASPGSGTPADGDLITFKDGGTTLGTGVLIGGVATLTTSSLAVGTHNFTANFPGDANFAASAGALNNYPVSNAVTTVAVSATPASHDVYGQAVALTASITSGTTAVNGGTVNFYLGTISPSNLLGTSSTVINGSTTITTTSTALPVSGGLTITAVYSGTTNIAGNTGTLTSYAVAQASTTTAVTSSAPISGFGQSVTFTATVTAVSPSTAAVNGGTVVFQDNGSTIGSGSVTNGVATFSTASLAQLPASHSITAIYNAANTGNFGTSTSPAISQTVLAASTTSVTLPTNPQFGQAIPYTVTVGPSGLPTGTVNLYNGAVSPANLIAGPLTLVGGSVSGVLPTLSAGSYTITAVYSGNSAYATSTGTKALTVVPSTTVTVLTVAPPSTGSAPVFGQPVSMTAVVTAALGGNPSSGVVTFTDATTNTVLGAASLSGSNSVSFTTTALSVATHTITAAFAASGNDAASNGSVANYAVHQAATTTTLASSAPSSVYGQLVTFSAAVTANSPSTVNPTIGTVTFKDGATVIASVNLNGSNVATFTSSTLTVATHTITATYNANTSYGASSATAISQVVAVATTTTALTASVPGGSQFGQSVTFTATITLAGGSVAKPTGTVKFMDGSTLLATVTLSGTSNTATYTTAALAVNPGHTLSAVFTSSNAHITGSTGILSPYAVTQAITTTTLTSSPANWSVGAPISFTAIVASTGGGTAIGTGTVTFVDTTTGNTLGTGKVVNGKVVLSFAGFTTAGAHSVIANFSGATNYGSSSSAALTETIVQVGLTSSANPALINTPVTFTATVTGAGSTPTGTVSFYDGTKLLGVVGLTGGVATLTTSTLAAGAHKITAVYSGDNTYNPGNTPAALTETVTTKIGNRLT